MDSNSIFQLLCLAFCIFEFSSANGLNELQCFVPGHCADSSQLESQQAADEFACLDQCEAKGPSCTWFSYFPQFKVCQLLANCARLETTDCQGCVSGQNGCSGDPGPICWATGACIGTVITIVEAKTKEDCLAQCKINLQCNWFTFISKLNACNLFADCPTLDSAAIDCISGERTCDGSTDKGNVAFIVGGEGSFEVELYSPEGQCQHLLRPVPGTMTEFWRPNLAYVDGKILAYGGSENNTLGWSYDAASDSWNVLAASSHPHNHKRGAVYDGKLYIEDEDFPEVYNPATNSWSTWPAPTIRTGADPCFLTWNSTFLLIGGKSEPKSVQSYNHDHQRWTVLGSSNIPIEVHNTACVVLPNDDILFVGSEAFADIYSVAVYNVPTNSWTKLNNTATFKEGSSLVSLSNRIFAIGGLSPNIIEEFHPTDSSWTTVSQSLLIPRVQHSSISLPASIFSDISGGCQGIN